VSHEHASSISQVAPTIAALLGIEPPRLCAVPVLPAVMQAAQAALAGAPVERMLVYAPDALGRRLLGRHPKELARLRRIAPCEVALRSVVPTLTPVCFASMFTGALPEAHGIRRYEKPVLACDTLFDALLRAGKRVAIAAVRSCSIDLIFRGRALDYFSEDYDPQVTARALSLLERGRHDFILAYHQEYDDLLHQHDPYGAECVAAFRRHVASFGELAAAAGDAWRGLRHAIACVPDHGAHLDPATGQGAHGSELPEDMELLHFWRINPAA
jgi:hypothetical protein